MGNDEAYKRGFSDGYHRALVDLQDLALWRSASYPEAWDRVMEHWRGPVLTWRHGDGGDPPILDGDHPPG